MLDGQADTAPNAEDDLVNFLVDNQEADAEEKTPNADDAPSDEDNALDATDEDGPADEESDEDDSEDAKKQTSGLKFKVPVKGADGADTSIEVDEKELIAGYQRHSDYTRKTQELASQSRELQTQVTAKVQESQTYYLQQAQLAHQAVYRLAGMKTPDEMAQLAQTDPGAWVAEQQREKAIRGMLGQLEEGHAQERAKLQKAQQEAQEAAFKSAWEVLGGKGIDKPTLKGIYDSITAEYGIGMDVLGTVMDPRAVEVMRDAAAYRALVKKRDSVTKQVKEAPRLPAQRQSVPKQEQVNKKLNARFRSGNAGLNDLASFIGNND